jgi:hypothetical protein
MSETDLGAIASLSRQPAGCAVVSVSAPLPALTAMMEGIVRDADDQPCARTVRAYRRHDGVMVGETTSDAVTGAFMLAIEPGSEHQRIILDTVTVPPVAEDDPPLRADLCARVAPA